jgi:hypothetical protein
VPPSRHIAHWVFVADGTENPRWRTKNEEQRTKNLGSPSGVPFEPPGEVNTPERLFEHDRLLRDNNFRLGGGIAYSLQKIDVFASYQELLRGTDSHGGRAITFGVSWPFEVGGGGGKP